MPATTVDGTMASSFRGGIARRNSRNRKPLLQWKPGIDARTRKSLAGNARALQKTVGKKHFASPSAPFQRPPFASHAFR